MKFFALLLFPAFSLADISTERQQQLLHLLKHDCGSCHGMTMQGGLGPALLPENLQDKPDEMLIISILEGRPGTPMPAWKSQLSDTEAAWLVRQLRVAESQKKQKTQSFDHAQDDGKSTR